MSLLTTRLEPRVRRWQAAGAVAVLAAALGMAGPTSAAPPDSPPTAPDGDDWATTPDTGAQPDGPALAAGQEFTLLTGDVVRVVAGGDGELTGEVVHDAGLPQDVRFERVNGELLALPGAAIEALAHDRVDEDLFNLTRLAGYGYDDASVDRIPVITTYDERTAARRGGLPVPSGARRTEALESIDAQALDVTKTKAVSTWEAVAAENSVVEKVWLDAKVHGTLDETVPAVGGPAAWEAGYDGTGTKIAVLDSGIDVSHPDVGAVDELTYEITDANGDTDTASLRVAVTEEIPAPEQPAAPAAVDDVAITRQDAPVAVPVLSNDIGEDLRIVHDGSQHLIGYEQHGTLTLNDDHSVTYTPDEGFVGTDEFLYVVTTTDRPNVYDRIEQLGMVRVTVGEATGPIAVDDLVTTPPETAVTVAVAGNDAGDGLRVAVDDGPDDGVAVVNDDDTITYTPDAGFTGSLAATQSFVPGETVQDGYGHGTHVASIAAGTGAASDGRYRGVAPGAELVIGKVLDDTGGGQTSWVIEGMEWAAGQGVDVVNMSLGGPTGDGTDPVSQALNRLTEETDTLFVAAAGNSGNHYWHFYHQPGLIGSPGTADRALTVGSAEWLGETTLKVSDWSSGGPRQGDHAIKPEILAPGCRVGEIGQGGSPGGCLSGVVAARAAGTFGGGYVDGSYATMNGTSMASPHVAGAAAIVAQQHPDWTAQQIKDALVSTADPIGASVAAQGAGLLDVAGAIDSPLLATGTMHLGRIQAPHPESVSGEVTLTNISAGALHADLSLDLRRADNSLDYDQPYSPEDGAVTISPSSVDIPAGESVTVTLTVRLESFDTPSAFFGRMEASVAGEVAARTTVGWTKDHELHRLSMDGIDRAGKPAHSNGYSYVNLWNLEEHAMLGTITSDGYQGGYWVDGEAYFPGMGFDGLLPAGTYMISGNIADWTAQAPTAELSETRIYLPELVLDRDVSLTFDARDATRIEFRPPEPDAVEDPLSDWAISMERTWKSPDGQARSWDTNSTEKVARSFYLFPAEPVRQGTFEVSVSKEYVAEDLTMTALGTPGSLVLHPRYAAGASYVRCGRPHPACNRPFTSPRPLLLVDGGTGTPEELAAADVAGKLVLVQETPDAVPINVVLGSEAMRAAGLAAQEAGAAGVLFAVADPGPPDRMLPGAVDLPVAVIAHAEAEALGEALDRGRPIRIRTGGTPVSPYSYQLTKTLDHIPADTAFEVTENELATIHARYHADQPGFILTPDLEVGVGTGAPFAAPTTRTEYVIGGEPYRSILETGEGEIQRVREYEAGAEVVEKILARPVAPLLDLQPNSLSPGSMQFGLQAGARAGFQSARSAFPASQRELRFLQDGQLICNFVVSFSSCGLDDPGRYQLELDTTGGAMMPGSTSTRWDVTVDRFLDDDGEPVIPPLAEVGYDVGVSLLNTVRAGGRYPITLTPAYQPGYEGDGGGEFTLSAWISHDDGETWTELGTRTVDNGGDARFTVTTPAGAEHASLRVTATDVDGNSVDQTMIRAWNVD